VSRSGQVFSDRAARVSDGHRHGVTRVTRRGYRAEGFTSLFASVLSVHRHVRFSPRFQTYRCTAL